MSRKKGTFPPNKDGNYVKYYKERLKEGYDKDDVFRIINAFATKDYADGVISITECAKFCNLWEKDNSWDNLEDKFIYRYWKSFTIDVIPTERTKRNKREQRDSCPILEVDFGRIINK